MKKEAKVEYGIAIVQPWSTEMYDHNDQVADIVRNRVLDMWIDALDATDAELDEEDGELSELDWDCASEEMIRIQTAVTCYGFASADLIETVCGGVEYELEEAAYFRLKEMAEELDIVLEKGFIGFN
jgi:hypothetical protein